MTSAALLELGTATDQWERIIQASARAAYAAGYADGQADERTEADRAWAGRPRQRVPPGDSLPELEARRWHLCCPSCRLGGHRDGCTDCEDRTAETFADPMRGDHTGIHHQRQERAA